METELKFDPEAVHEALKRNREMHSVPVSLPDPVPCGPPQDVLRMPTESLPNDPPK